jgi:hypothetical protein
LIIEKGVENNRVPCRENLENRGIALFRLEKQEETDHAPVEQQMIPVPLDPTPEEHHENAY